MRLAALAVAVTLASVGPIDAQAQVPEDSIGAAIQRGLKTKKPEFVQGGSGTVMAQGRGYDVTVLDR
jgi:hypothetical protein